MESKIDFFKGNAVKNLINMVTPLFIAMLLTMAYNIVDSLFVGNMLGEEGYAALTNSVAVVMILSAIAMGASNGITIIVSQKIGARSKKGTDGVISTMLVVSFIFSLVVSVLCEVFLKNILFILNTPTELFDMAYSYLSIYILGYIAIYMYMHITAVFRAFGDSMLQMKGMLITTLLNAVLDPIMIHFFGLMGAAWATVIAEVLCLIFAIVYNAKKKMFKFESRLISREYLKPMLSNAVPSAIQSCIPAISSATMLVLVSVYGVTTIAGYGVTSKLEILMFYPSMAMNMAITAIVGQCYGAKMIDKAKEYVKISLVIGGIFTAVVSALVLIFAGQLSGLFINSAEAAEIVKGFFKIISVGYLMYMFTSCFLGELSGFGKPSLSMILFIIYYIIIRIPLALVLSKTSLGLNGIWVAILISHVIAAIIALVMSKFAEQKAVTKEELLAA